MRRFLVLIKWHETAVCAVLLAHLLVCGGLPLRVLPDREAARSERFPCERHCCGCSSARHCWTECRCMSLTEKLQWAQQNRVKPPPYVASKQALSSTVASCQACCTAGEDASPPRLAATHPPDGQPRFAAQKRAAGRWVLTWQAQRCRGAAIQWCSSGASLPVTVYFAADRFAFCNDYVAAFTNFYTPTVTAPDSPPPRHGRVRTL